MAICIYRNIDGSLYSFCQNDTDPVAPDNVLAANGLSKIVGTPPLDSTHVWDPATRTVLTVSAPVLPRPLSAFDFINAFTAAEWAAVLASANTGVIKARSMINAAGTLDMNNQNVATALTLFVNQGILTAPRAVAIAAAVAT